MNAYTDAFRQDPNAPKRNGGPYILYSNSVRDKIVAENSHLSFTEVGRLIGTMYRELPPPEKAIWVEKAAAEKARYGKEMEEYKKRLTDAKAA